MDSQGPPRDLETVAGEGTGICSVSSSRSVSRCGDCERANRAAAVAAFPRLQHQAPPQQASEQQRTRLVSASAPSRLSERVPPTGLRPCTLRGFQACLVWRWRKLRQCPAAVQIRVRAASTTVHAAIDTQRDAAATAHLCCLSPRAVVAPCTSCTLLVTVTTAALPLHRATQALQGIGPTSGAGILLCKAQRLASTAISHIYRNSYVRLELRTMLSMSFARRELCAQPGQV